MDIEHKLAVVSALTLGIMSLVHKIRIRRAKNREERLRLAREEQARLNDEAIRRAKSERCIDCGQPIFPTAIDRRCTACLLERMR